MKYPRFLFALLSILWLTACTTPQQLPINRNLEFTILQMNDVYEIAPLEGGKAGGLARVAAVLQQLEQENPNTIAVLSGDFLSPSFIGTLKTDEGEKVFGLQMVETLNALGLDYVTFGNHEFDTSDPELLQKRIDQSDFRYVVCNVSRVKDDGSREPFTQRGKPIPPYLVHEFADAAGAKVKVALIGVLLPFNKQPYLYYAPVFSSFQEAYKKARAEADIVLGITHLDVEQDMELAEKVPGTALFMGGHDHSNMNHYVEQTIITKADANAKTVYVHRIKYNPASRMTSIRSSLKVIDNTIEEDPATAAIVQKWQTKVNKLMTDMGFDPGRELMVAKETLECKEPVVRTRQTNYGALTVAAFEALWPGADVYLINSGSMRLDDNISGVITEYDVLRTFPFGGGVVKVEMPGRVLKDVLQAGLVQNKGEGGYLQISEVTNNKKGGWQIKGQNLDPERNYQVVMPKFLAGGGEQNLEFLGELKSQGVESFQVKGQTIKNDVRDMVIWYMRGME